MRTVFTVVLIAATLSAAAQSPVPAADRPDPREIPLPPIHTPLEGLPGPQQLPVQSLPPLMRMDDGRPVHTAADWQKRRMELRRTLAYYAVGQAPAAPTNLRSEVLQSTPVLDGRALYRLVRLHFGPDLSLHIGVFTPNTSKGPFPVILAPAGTPPGAPELPRSPSGPTQGRGEDVLLVVGGGQPSHVFVPGGIGDQSQPTADQIAHTRADVLSRGYALVIFNSNDAAEDTTLRDADGSFTFRHTRFAAAYPQYDWGVLRIWAWAAARIADYLQTDPRIDHQTMIITGASRAGKAAMIAAAFDDRLIGAPVVTGGGGIGLYRLTGPEHSETLDQMVRKYPNWFSPQLHDFWGQRERLPFDEHWFLALAAPRPFIALEGDADAISLPAAVQASIEAARPAYALLGASPELLSVHYAHHAHAFTTDDWTALLDFIDHINHHRALPDDFNRYPSNEERQHAIQASHK